MLTNSVVGIVCIHTDFYCTIVGCIAHQRKMNQKDSAHFVDKCRLQRIFKRRYFVSLEYEFKSVL